MVHIGNDTVAAMRQARAEEYGKYVAVEEIYIDGVLAFGKGFPVPISHVEKYPELLEEDAVTTVQQAGAPGQPPAANAKRALWADYARTQGATDAELADVRQGGLSRKALMDRYGGPEDSGAPAKAEGEPATAED
jgi:hypothetical protein